MTQTKPTGQPTLRFHADMNVPGSGRVGVSGLDPGAVAFLASNPTESDLLKSVFRVSVVSAEAAPEGDGLPDVFGRCQVGEDGLWFIPHFPFARGVKYRASFDPRPLGGALPAERLTLEFSLPEVGDAARAEVDAVFPSADSLPENLLRFYVRFSTPMQRGLAEEQIALLDADGQPVPDVLYRAPVELWDRSMRHLTVLLDPGRLKRGVGPNVELGPPLQTGREYTLVIGAGILNSCGRPLRAAFRKRFRVTEAVREPIAVLRWEIIPPPAGSRQPLVLTFPQPLDWAMLWQAMRVETISGLPINGRVAIGQTERRWSFAPTLPWATGSYRVRIEPSLEDVCGNTVVAAFDRPFRAGGSPVPGAKLLEASKFTADLAFVSLNQGVRSS